jgi:type II secretory pathway pseudopilin PulG
MHKPGFDIDHKHSEPFTRPRRRTPRRRGALMVEMLVGTILLGAFLAGVLPVIAWIRTSQHTTEEQRIAALELANQMERVAALSAAQRTPEILNALKLSPEATAILDDAELTSRYQESDAFPGLQQIQLSLTWTNDSHQRVNPAQLTGWFKPATTADAAP